jgi:hypothetical protein
MAELARRSVTGITEHRFSADISIRRRVCLLSNYIH